MMKVRGGNGIREYVLLQYMEVKYLIDEVDETTKCGCLRWSISEGEYHSLVR